MKTIFQLIDQLNSSENKKKYLLLKEKIDFAKIFKKFKREKIKFAILRTEKISLINFIRIFIIFSINGSIYKNFFIFFNYKREILAHNFFPDWPDYKCQNFLSKLILWIKKFSSVFFRFKYIYFIAFKIR